jgi:putative transposase
VGEDRCSLRLAPHKALKRGVSLPQEESDNAKSLHEWDHCLGGSTVAEGGERATEICRKLGISEQTFYTWKRKYVGMALSELRELRQLRDENRKLKKLVADLLLDRHMLQEIVQKKL